MLEDDTVRVIVWLADQGWEAGVDAARALPPGAEIVLLYVTSSDGPGAARAAFSGLLGRGPLDRGQPGRDPADAMARLTAKSAAAVLAAAAGRLARPAEQIRREGRVEREVVAVAADAGLLVVVRDGDTTRLGPRSVGPAARFVVDHAPCPVLLVWPGRPPAVGSIPPPPPARLRRPKLPPGRPDPPGGYR